MSRYINADAFIAYLMELANDEHNKWCFPSMSTALQDVADFVEGFDGADVQEIMASAWIPVTERLPKVGRYLVCYHPCNDDRVDWSVKRVGLDSFKKGGWARAKYQRIIAWMPLPEEWKGL